MDRLVFAGCGARSSGAVLVGTAGILTLIGVFHVLAAVLPKAMLGDLDSWMLLGKHAIFVLLALIVAAATARIDYNAFVRRAPRLLASTWLVLLIVLLLPPVNGARRWLNVGPFGMQASELAKVSVVFAAAWWAKRQGTAIATYFKGFAPAATALAITVALIAAEPDFGTSLFLLTTAGVLLFLAGVPLWHVVVSAGAALPLFVVVMIDKFAHVMDRLASFRDGPHEQVERGLEAMAAGGLDGARLGEARAALWFVPYVETDLIFAEVGEQFGFLGTVGVLALFLVFLRHGLRVAMMAVDRTGFLVAFGLTFVVVFQALINMTVATGLAPPKGIGLPFVSYGGSSLVILGFIVGVLYSIAARGVDESPFPVKTATARPQRVGVGALEGD